MATYSNLFDPTEGDDKARAGINLRYGIEAQPDQSARDADLAKRYGLPAGVIEAYRPDYESRAKVEDAMPLLEQSPKLRGWLAADPVRAKVSHDDIGNLSAIEGAIRYMVSAPDAPRGGLVADVFKAGRAIASGAPSASAGLYGAAAAPFEVLGLDTIGQALRGQQKNAQAVSDSVRGMSPDAGFLEQSLMSGFQSAGQNLITLPLGLAAKTPNLMLGIMGAITGGQSYGKGRDDGLDPAQAAAFGIQDATAEIVTERFLGAAGFLKNIKAGASAGKLFGHEVFKEVPGEIGATLWQNFNEWANVNPDKSVHDFLSEQPAAIAQTVIATLVGGSVQIGAVKGIEAAVGRAQAVDQQAQRAEFGAAQMDAIAAIVQASKLNARSPETFGAMVQEMAAENVPAVFVSAQALMQSGVNLDELAKAMPSVAAQMQTAAQTGGDIEIPTAEFVRAVPGSTFQQQMIDHARTSPDAMSRAEAQVFMSEKGDAIKAELDAEITRREEDSTWRMQRDEVALQFEQQLNDVGRFQPAVNKQYATLFGNFYATTASRAGMTAGDLAAKYPLRFQATAPGGGNVMGQGDQASLADVRSAWDTAGLKSAITEKVGTIEVGQIVVPADQRGQGVGTAAMRKLLDYADATGQRVVLTPSSDFGGSKSRLVKFYKSLGFVENKGRNKDFTTMSGMIREPAQALNQSAQVDQTETSAFKTWFGDSIVVDEDGNPLVVYHGSADAFDVFDGSKDQTASGFWFAEEEGFAEDFGAVVRPMYLSIANPVDLTPATGRRYLENWSEIFRSVGVDDVVFDSSLDPGGDYAFNELLPNKGNDLAGDGNLIAAIRAAGFDGIHAPDEAATSGYETGNVWIAFESTQIKSVNNTGAFDPANPSILNHSSGAEPSSGPTPLAQIAIPDDGVMGNTTVITMFDGANLSSVLHEAGHFFLEVQADLAARIAGQIRDGSAVSDGEREILADMNRLLAWFGERDMPEASALDQWLAKSIDERRAQHERFAESFEQYLMEGRSPSVELAPLFSRFKAWFESVYTSVKQFLARRGVSQAQGNALEQSAFHGTPQRGIDKFSTDKIGTGEGAQAYGWGLYFASKKEIAEWYRKTLSPSTIFYGAKKLSNNSRNTSARILAEAIDSAVKENPSIGAWEAVDKKIESNNALMAEMMGSNATWHYNKHISLIRQETQQLEGLDRNKILKVEAGQLYEVDVPEDSELLLWDKPLSEQPDVVREALADVEIPNRSGKNILEIDPTGEEMYRAISRHQGGDSETSQWLAKFGIRGIKYLDGTSRGAGDGSHNYVIFSGDDVVIRRTYYQSGPGKNKQISDIQLTDEVRQVMDRMIATADQIQEAETVRAMGPLFTEQGSMSPEQWAEYQKTGAKATETAVNSLQAKAMADMKWLSNARAKKLRELQKQADALRREVRIEATREVMSRPVYRAWQFLTTRGEADQQAQQEPRVKGSSGALDPATDNIFQAIAKLGGMNRDEVTRVWGIDPKDRIESAVFGRPVVRKEGGLSIDAMTEALVEQGYLMPDENGKGDPRDLEEAFDSQRRGVDQFSVAHDYAERARAAQGDMPIDTLPDNVTHGKLDTNVLREMYSTQAQAVWRKLSDRRMTSDRGIQPDVLAETLGFASGDAMVRELADARPPRDVIRDLTDQRMLEQHGELATPDGLERATTEALANSVRTRFLAQELQALEDASNPRADAGTASNGTRRTANALDKAAEQYAAQTIGAMAIKDIKPHKFEAAATRAAKLAARAFKAGNTAEAAMHKRSELIQLHAAKAAHAALAEVDQARTRFRDITGRSIDKLGKSYDVDVVQAIRAILGEYGIGTNGEQAAKYLEAVERNDPDMHRVLSAQIAAMAQDAKPFDTLSIDAMRALVDEVGALWHLARRSKQMEVDGNLIDRQDVQADLLARLDEIGIPDTMPGEGRAVTDKERRVARLREAAAALMRVENWAIRKDGADNGVFTRIVFRPIKAASDAYRSERGQVLRRYRELLAGVNLGVSRISAPELGYEFGHSKGGSGKAELLHAILHTGNESNKRKLLLGRGWAATMGDGESIDAGRWDRFVERMIREGVLTKADFDFAQGVWDLLESLKPRAQKTHRDVFGRYFDEITAAPVVNSLGTWSGGYVPAMTDAEIVKDAKTRELAEAENSTMAFAFPATGKGFTKSRVEYNRPLLLDLRSLAGHIDKVLLFSHLEQPVRDVRRVLAAQEVAEPLHKVDPAAFGSLITPWLNRAARQQVETPIPGDGGAMRILSKLRARAGMAAMFANLANTAQQVTGFSIAAVKVPPRHLMSAAHRWITSPRKTADAVAEASPYMRERMSAETHQMTQDIEQILLNPSLYERAQDWAARHAYFMQSAVDNVMGPIIWTGAYNSALEQGQTEDDARAMADGVVRQTQGSTLPEDISRIESGNAWWRMFAQFAGYFNMQANLLGTEFANQMHDVGLRKGMGKGLYIFTLGFLVPALLSELIVQAFRGGPDDDDKDGQTIDDWFAAFGMGTVRSAVAMVPVAGQVANYGINLANTKPYDDRISTAPAVSMLESAVRAPFSVYGAVVEDASAQKAVRDVATLISLTTGLPANAIARPIGYVAGMATDKINPTDPIDMARGLTTGIASPESK